MYLYIVGSTSTGSCYCCQEPVECWLTMPTDLIDGTTTPFADETTAQAALDDRTAGCAVERDENTYGIFSSFAATASSSSVAWSASISGEDSGGGNYSIDSLFLSLIKVNAAGNIEVAQDLTGTTGDSARVVGVSVYEEDGTLVDSQQSADTPFTTYAPGTFTFSLPAAGIYQVLTSISKVSNAGDNDADFDGEITGIDGFCPIRAAYDDGGGTSYLICA